MAVEEGAKSGGVDAAGGAECRAGDLVYEVVVVVDEDLGDCEGVVEIALADEAHGAEHGDAAVPEVFGASEFVEDVARLVGEVAADGGHVRVCPRRTGALSRGGGNRGPGKGVL